MLTANLGYEAIFSELSSSTHSTHTHILFIVFGNICQDQSAFIPYTIHHHIIPPSPSSIYPLRLHTLTRLINWIEWLRSIHINIHLQNNLNAHISTLNNLDRIWSNPKTYSYRQWSSEGSYRVQHFRIGAWGHDPPAPCSNIIAIMTCAETANRDSTLILHDLVNYTSPKLGEHLLPARIDRHNKTKTAGQRALLTAAQKEWRFSASATWWLEGLKKQGPSKPVVPHLPSSWGLRDVHYKGKHRHYPEEKQMGGNGFNYKFMIIYW